jgi:hypothetical protein
MYLYGESQMECTPGRITINLSPAWLVSALRQSIAEEPENIAEDEGFANAASADEQIFQLSQRLGSGPARVVKRPPCFP